MVRVVSIENFITCIFCKSVPSVSTYERSVDSLSTKLLCNEGYCSVVIWKVYNVWICSLNLCKLCIKVLVSSSIRFLCYNISTLFLEFLFKIFHETYRVVITNIIKDCSLTALKVVSSKFTANASLERIDEACSENVVTCICNCWSCSSWSNLKNFLCLSKLCDCKCTTRSQRTNDKACLVLRNKLLVCVYRLCCITFIVFTDEYDLCTVDSACCIDFFYSKVNTVLAFNTVNCNWS